MTRRLLLLYLVVAFGPVVAFSAAFAARDLFGGRRAPVPCLREAYALPEIGHACGHNLIATAGLGAAYGLKAALSPDEVSLVVLGTPAEGDGGGESRGVWVGARG